MIQEISRIEDLRAIAGEWEDLWDRSPRATPFASPEWLLAWWEHLFGGGEMWTLAARNRGRLAGLAPMFIHGADKSVRQISLIGAGVTDYLDFLAEDAISLGELWKAVCSARAGRCVLDDVPPESGLVGLAAVKCPSNICPAVELPGSFGEFEASLTPRFRHHLRNSRHRLLDLGAVPEAGDPERDDEYLDALFRLHTARWQARGQSGVLASKRVQAFLRDALAGFRRRRWLRFHGIRYEGELIAVLCIFCARQRSYYYLGGFDAKFSTHSPGNVLIAFAIECAIAESSLSFDFLRQPEPYKYRWGALDRINHRIVIDLRTSAA